VVSYDHEVVDLWPLRMASESSHAPSSGAEGLVPGREATGVADTMIEIPLKAEKLTLHRIGGYTGVRHANCTMERTKSREREVSRMARKSAYIALTDQTSPMIPASS